MFKLFNCFKEPVTKIHTESSKKKPFCIDDNILNDTSSTGHIYMIREREFINSNENIFKIGKSTKIVNRMPAYPKQSKIYMIFYSPYNIHKMEKFIINKCDEMFVCRHDIGREYYECSSESMLRLLCTIIDQMNLFISNKV